MFTYAETTLYLNETFIDFGLEYRGSQHWTFCFSSKIKRNRTVNSAPDMKDNRDQSQLHWHKTQSESSVCPILQLTVFVMPKCQNAYQPHFVG